MPGYINAYKSAKQMLDNIRSGQDREERASKAEGARRDLEEGLLRRRKAEQEKPQDEGFNAKSFFTDYMQLANFTLEADPATAPDASTQTQVKGPVGTALKALGQLESSNNFQAVGPVVKKGRYKGQRAYGKYQVMEGNIGPWTKEATGKAYTKEEFLANKDNIQTVTAAYRMTKAYKKHGSWEDAASVWFSGQPLKKAGNRSDGYNTVPEYVTKFTNYFNQYKNANDDAGTFQAPVATSRPPKKGLTNKEQEV